MTDSDDAIVNSYPPELRETVAAALSERRRRAVAKNRKHRGWGKGLEGQRIPGYLLVLTELTRRGRTKRASFVLAEDTWDEPGGPHWERVTEKTAHWQDPLHSRHVIASSEALPATVHLAKDLDLPATMLVVILDALLSDSRHAADIADIRRVRSQLGSRIVQLDALPSDKRQHAEPALYHEVLRRCTNI